MSCIKNHHSCNCCGEINKPGQICQCEDMPIKEEHDASEFTRVNASKFFKTMIKEKALMDIHLPGEINNTFIWLNSLRECVGVIRVTAGSEKMLFSIPIVLAD